MEKNKIYNIDCVEGMKQMIGEGILVDCILTSPPYNTETRNATKGKYDNRYDTYEGNLTNDEYIKWTIELFNCFDKVLSPNGKILYNLNYGSENTECMNLTVAEILRNTNFTLADIIVWEKNCALPQNMSANKLTRVYEFIYVFVRRNEFMTFTTNKQAVGKHHGTQVVYENIPNKISAKNNDEVCPYNFATFSTELVYKLLNIYCKNGELVMDPFMGSGATAVACYKKGLDFIGFELSPKQVEWANERLEKTKQQISIFE